MDERLVWMDAVEQAQLVSNGEASPEELVDEAIARIEAINPQVNAVIHERFDAARSEAKGELAGPFAGVPIVLKDLGAAMAGEPYHEGLAFAKAASFRTTEDSYIVERFRKAGFVVLGRTNCPELGSTITTEPIAYGPTRNPWNLDHTTGGSSGGSAAAVASGMVAVAHGNDGGGSIRVPASNCGLFGLKPSRGRVSQGPKSEESDWNGSTIDHVLSRTVRDSAACLDVLSGYMPGDHYVAPPPARPFAAEVGADPGQLKIGWMDQPAMEGFSSHAECVAAVGNAVGLLESLGHKLEQAHPAVLGHADFQRHFLTLVTASVAFSLAHWSELLGREISPSELEPDNQMFQLLGSSLSAVNYLQSVQWCDGWRNEMEMFWAPEDIGGEGYDLLCSPVLAIPPSRIGELSEPIVGGQRVIEALQFTAQFNVTGQPAMSVPLHTTADGLPVGVQFVAAYGREDLLYRVASQLEQAAPWAGRLPRVHA